MTWGRVMEAEDLKVIRRGERLFVQDHESFLAELP
jgi:hypothetical protein